MMAMAAGVPAERILAARVAEAATAPEPSKAQRLAAWLQRDPYFFRKPEPPPGLRFMAGERPKKRRYR